MRHAINRRIAVRAHQAKFSNHYFALRYRACDARGPYYIEDKIIRCKADDIEPMLAAASQNYSLSSGG